MTPSRRLLTAAVGGLAVLAAGCTSSAAPATSTTAAPIATGATTAPVVTTDTGTPDTASHDTGTGGTGPNGGAGPSTTAQSASSNELVAALPTAAEMPDGWHLGSGVAVTELDPATGNFVGICSKGNRDALALQRHVLAVADGDYYDAPQGGAGSVTLYSFATPGDAHGYLQLTAADGACTQHLTVPEGPGRGQYDGFDDPSVVGTVQWAITQTATVTDDHPANTDEALVLHVQNIATTTRGGVRYAGTTTSITAVERYGRFVLVADLAAYCCTAGYHTQAGSYRAVVADLAPALTAFRAHARQVLHARGLL